MVSSQPGCKMRTLNDQKDEEIPKWREKLAEWRASTEYKIGCSVILGGLLSIISILLYTTLCGGSDTGLCGLVQEDPPWFLVTGLALAPATILLWFWRDKHRRDDIMNARANIENEKANIETAIANNLIADKGQVTERFSRAIEHLGVVEIEVHLGGIYALEKIAGDYPDDYMSTIIETLSAFVRVRSNKRDEEQEQRNESSQKPNVDVQAALTVLGRMGKKTDTIVDLTGANLKNVNLYEAHLERGDLRWSHLEGARLEGAHLERASFDKAHLEGACLDRAHLEQAFLFETHLEKATLIEAHLEDALFWKTHLEEAVLAKAHLEGARLDKAHLERSFLEGARYNSGTVFPEGFDPEKAVMIFVDDEEEQAFEKPGDHTDRGLQEAPGPPVVVEESEIGQPSDKPDMLPPQKKDEQSDQSEPLD